MKWIGLIVVAALPALAQSPTFLSSAPVTVPSGDALNRLELPLEAYRDSRADLADIRILNAAGEEVPYSWAGEVNPVRETPVATTAQIFPLTRAQPVGTVGDEVTVRTQDGTLVSVRPRRGPTKALTMVSAYLVDASQLKGTVGAFIFEWTAGPGTQVVNLRLEASDDLKSWTSVAAGPIVKVEAGGRTLTQPRLEFAPRESKYYRITWSGPGFALSSVKAETAPATKPAPRLTRTVTATRGAKPEELLFDLGARLPVEAVRIVPADTNAVLSVTLYARNDPEAQWRMVASTPFYRLTREGGEMHSPAVEVGRNPARYWMARLAEGSSKGPLPTLEAQWRPAQLVFVARGERPFSIAFGKPANNVPGALPITAVMPNYERGMEMKLAQATMGAVVSGPPPSRWDRLLGEMNAKRIGLWAILLLGVAVLGFMAWRLSRSNVIPAKAGTQTKPSGDL